MRSHQAPDPWGHDPRDQRQQQFEPTAPSVWQDSEDSTFAVPCPAAATAPGGPSRG